MDGKIEGEAGQEKLEWTTPELIDLASADEVNGAPGPTADGLVIESFFEATPS